MHFIQYRTQGVFDKIPERNPVCWTSMIVGYAQSNIFKEAIELVGRCNYMGLKQTQQRSVVLYKRADVRVH